MNGHLLLYSLNALFQFGKFLFAFFSLKFEYAQMLLFRKWRNFLSATESVFTGDINKRLDMYLAKLKV